MENMETKKEKDFKQVLAKILLFLNFPASTIIKQLFMAA
jgi:hypothetical protein